MSEGDLMTQAEMTAPGLQEDVTCADCGWLGPWFDTYRILEPRDRQEGRRGFYLCVHCWDRIVGATELNAFR